MTNQVPPLVDTNGYTTDRALMDAVARAADLGSGDLGGGDIVRSHHQRLSALGARAGSEAVIRWGMEADRHSPVLVNWDHYGHRIDEVHFHPAYHALMAMGLEAGYAAVAWDGTAAGHVLHGAIAFLCGRAESGTGCPMTMTYAAVPALSVDPTLAAQWVPRITSAAYDPRTLPAAAKSGVTIGMAMTEKQGGSDVRANSTQAEAIGDGLWFRLTGHKWFCSAPMCDAFLTLAYAPGGLTCYLLPRWLPDGTRNAGFRVMRLKDKLGDRSNASSEVEYHGALAQRVGEEGRGIATILQMVQLTRLDCVLGSAQQMRSALALALWHAQHRTAFQRRLIDQPAMAQVLADLAVESEAATMLAFRLARAFDMGEPLARLLTPIAKYWVCKRAPGFVAEAMECLGGAGYVETGPMPRLFRQSPLNAIWEGSGNVIALDVLRALTREAEGVAALRQWLDSARPLNSDYAHWLDATDWALATPATARLFIEHLALAAQAAALLHWDSPIAESFCALRLKPRGLAYGAFAYQIDHAALLARAAPQ